MPPGANPTTSPAASSGRAYPPTWPSARGGTGRHPLPSHSAARRRLPLSGHPAWLTELPVAVPRGRDRGRDARVGARRRQQGRGGPEPLEGQVDAERELPQRDRQRGERVDRGGAVDDPEEDRDVGGKQQRGADERHDGQDARYEAG